MAIQINGDSGISGVNGSAGTPALQGTDSNTGIVFGTDTVQVSTGGSTRVTVDSSGNVTTTGTATFGGVGTFSGDLRVQDGGNFRVRTAADASSDAILLQNNGNITASGSATFNGVLKVNRSVSGDGCFNADLNGVTKASITSAGSASFAGGAFAIASDGDISTNIRGHGHLELDSTGSFGSPKVKLFGNTGAATFAGHVKSTNGSGSAFLGASSGSGLAINNSSNATVVELNYDGSATFASTVTAGNTSTGCQWFSNGSGIGRLSGTQKWYLNNNGNVVFAGSVTASNVSDIRFKENITDANPQLADAVALGSQLKNWDWKDNAPLNDELRAKRFLGLVAQEAEKACPGLTYTVPRTKRGKELTAAVLDENGNETKAATYEELDDSYKAINHDILVMKLLGAVAEQNTQIETLKARVTTLEAG